LTRNIRAMFRILCNVSYTRSLMCLMGTKVICMIARRLVWVPGIYVYGAIARARVRAQILQHARQGRIVQLSEPNPVMLVSSV